MAKLPQKLHAVHSSQSQTIPIRCDFCGGDHPNCHCTYQTNSPEGKMAFPTIILKVGKIIKIKILGGSKTMVHPISNDLSS